MIQAAFATLVDLYEVDETAWLETMADFIQQGRLGDLDYPHLQEYLTDMAGRDRREVQSRLAVLLVHVLKWEYQPDHRSRSWRGTVIAQRQELARHVSGGVLRKHAEEVLAVTFAEAVELVAAETGIAADAFPRECPYTLEQLLSPDLLQEQA